MDQFLRNYNLTSETDFSDYYAMVQAHYDAGRWSEYLTASANKDRATELLMIMRKVDRPSRLRPLVNEVWSMSNNIAADELVWGDIWQFAYRRSGVLRRCNRHTRATDRRVFDGLPEQVPVYRGINHAHFAEGYSWTLDYAPSVRTVVACTTFESIP